MNAKEFFFLVAKMRKAQSDYFSTRSQRALLDSKMYEREVDAEIKRVEKIQQQKADNQQLKML